MTRLTFLLNKFYEFEIEPLPLILPILMFPAVWDKICLVGEIFLLDRIFPLGKISLLGTLSLLVDTILWARRTIS